MRSSLLMTILAGLTAAGCGAKGEWQSTSLCIDVPDDATTCPAQGELDPDSLFSFGWCSSDIRSIDGAGQITDNPFWGDTASPDLVCCYEATARDASPNCVVGRPFLADGQAQLASARAGVGWLGSGGEPGEPNVAMAQAWLDAALGEHASIAAFARVTLELMALGAPADLVADCQRAASDEVRHAQLCFDQVRHFGGGAQEPGPFPIPATLDLGTDPVSMAVAAVREGCVGETVSAWLAERAAERATDATSKEVLTQIAADEARHAALSWRMVAWLIEAFGPAVRDAVVATLAEPVEVGPMLPGDGSLAEFGAISRAEHAALIQAARDEVLVPAASVLLAA